MLELVLVAVESSVVESTNTIGPVVPEGLSVIPPVFAVSAVVKNPQPPLPV